MALNLLRNTVIRFKSCKFNTFRSLNTVSNASKPNTPVLVNLTSNLQNNWIYRQEDALKLPFISKISPVSTPNGWWVPPQEEPANNRVVEAPAVENVIEKQAARLIVIRRKKMKKHKLRKLRKKMKYEWAKKRQRRELKKEKDFQAGLIAQCKQAENFSAEGYVEERLQKLNEQPLPNRWKGRRLPEFIIREKLGLPSK